MIDTRKERPRVLVVSDDGGRAAMKAAAVMAVAAVAISGVASMPVPNLTVPVLVDPTRRTAKPNRHHPPPREQGTREMARRQRQAQRKAGTP